MKNNLHQYIEIVDGVRSGKPCITGTRITVADVAMMYLRMGQSLEEIAGKYQLPLAAVYMAMAFYFEHRQEIDRRTMEAEALAEAERIKQPSLLQEKLSAARDYV
ncbi:DUF433 domain-containing protein [Chlorogloeopsis sp. ULAP01]|uniref:DUF433 domain-containing protein n=1 Tax=Chlorogloeopsis sp. ULAP01 TaxID=3056483 RepID=UPI0025AB4402|nr:DUF433 domain-containing protein [Chlorogloeopsis sp. ULAP01]MDM9382550.1 DUF433 domain-containing protein [Chlorogloeopsis sp. ULAP01]